MKTMQGESAYEGTLSHSSYLPAPSAVGVDVGDGRIEINRDPAMTAPSPVRLPTTSPRPSPLLLEQLTRPHVNTDAHTFSYPIPAPPPPLPSASPRPSSKTPSAQPPVTTILPPPPSGAGLGAPAAYAALFDQLAAGDLADAHAHGQVALAVDGGSLGLRRGERLLNRIQLRRTIKQVRTQAGGMTTQGCSSMFNRPACDRGGVDVPAGDGSGRPPAAGRAHRTCCAEQPEGGAEPGQQS